MEININRNLYKQKEVILRYLRDRAAESFGEDAASAAVSNAVASLLTSGRIRSLEVGEHATDEIGEMIAAEL